MVDFPLRGFDLTPYIPAHALDNEPPPVYDLYAISVRCPAHAISARGHCLPSKHRDHNTKCGHGLTLVDACALDLCVFRIIPVVSLAVTTPLSVSTAKPRNGERKRKSGSRQQGITVLVVAVLHADAVSSVEFSLSAQVPF